MKADQDYFILILRNKIINWFKSDYAARFLLLSYAHSSPQCGSSPMVWWLMNNLKRLAPLYVRISLWTKFWRQLINWIFDSKLLRLKKVIEGVPWKIVWLYRHFIGIFGKLQFKVKYPDVRITRLKYFL